MEQLTKNQAVATSQEAVQNQNEPQLRDENAHNDKSVHGVLNPTYQAGLRRDAVQPDIEAERKMREFDLSLRSSRSSYSATIRHQLTILSKTDALDEEKCLNMLGTFVKNWFRYESHFVHGRDSLVDILKERGLLSESDAVQPLIGKKSCVKLLNNPYVSRPLWPLLSSFRLLPFWI